jgi:hypothetical protein
MGEQPAGGPSKDGIDTPVPVIWLIGKAQAGKTSIAAQLTGLGGRGRCWLSHGGGTACRNARGSR